MQGIDVKKANEMISFAKNFYSLGIVSFATGKIKCTADSKETVEILKKVFDWTSAVNPEAGGNVFGEKESRRNLLTGKWEKTFWFGDYGIGGEYKWTIMHLFQLAYGVEGLDYNLLQNSNFSMEFDYAEDARVVSLVREVKEVKITHKKVDDPTQPYFTDGKEKLHAHSMESTLLMSLKTMAPELNDECRSGTADYLCLDIAMNTERYGKESVIEAIRKNKEVILKTFNISSLLDICKLAETFNENETKDRISGVEEILRKASE